jgi:hypothetical protein
VLGFGDRLVAAGLEELGSANDRLRVNISADELKKRPEYRYRDKGLHSSYYYRTWGNTESPPESLPVAPAPFPPAQESSPRASGQGPDESWAYSPPRYLASVLIGRKAYNRLGVNLGDIEDLLIENGRVSAFILSRNGILDEQECVAAPYKPPGFSPQGVVLGITEKESRALPEYPYEALMKEGPGDGPFGRYYTPPGVVEPDIGPSTQSQGKYQRR